MSLSASSVSLKTTTPSKLPVTITWLILRPERDQPSDDQESLRYDFQIGASSVCDDVFKLCGMYRAVGVSYQQDIPTPATNAASDASKDNFLCIYSFVPKNVVLRRFKYRALR